MGVFSGVLCSATGELQKLSDLRISGGGPAVEIAARLEPGSLAL
jgi:hypothetical protein